MTAVDTSPLQDRLGFARQVKAPTHDELLDLTRSPRRAPLLDDIVADLPAVFLADRAGDLDAVVRWKVTGNANPKLLFLRGRMKARGDLGLTTRFPSQFGTPRA
jgi:hypothetical protein